MLFVTHFSRNLSILWQHRYTYRVGGKGGGRMDGTTKTAEFRVAMMSTYMYPQLINIVLQSLKRYRWTVKPYLIFKVKSAYIGTISPIVSLHGQQTAL